MEDSKLVVVQTIGKWKTKNLARCLTFLMFQKRPNMYVRTSIYESFAINPEKSHAMQERMSFSKYESKCTLTSENDTFFHEEEV